MKITIPTCAYCDGVIVDRDTKTTDDRGRTYCSQVHEDQQFLRDMDKSADEVADEWLGGEAS